jgi:hypothetical protein
VAVFRWRTLTSVVSSAGSDCRIFLLRCSEAAALGELNAGWLTGSERRWPLRWELEKKRRCRAGSVTAELEQSSSS